ncbi:hypothetical protein BC941DRAFT_443040 [Chlamydoabsidia padenii]|nr:hypothetical protein BC941DRAFT_443040 [Chlamydoabsidia padenii]
MTELVPYDAASSDVWSVGILLLALLFGRNPWQEATGMDPSFAEYKRDPFVIKTHLFPTLSLPCAHFLQQVLTVHGPDRPSITQVKEQFMKLDTLLVEQQDNDDYTRISMDIPPPKSTNKASFDSAIFSAASLTSTGMSWSDMVEEDYQRDQDSYGCSSLSSSSILEEEDYDDTDMFVHSQEKESWWL